MDIQEIIETLKTFEWTDDNTVATFERFVEKRQLQGDIEIPTNKGWLKWVVPGDWRGNTNHFWENQFSRSPIELKKRLREVARKADLKGDDFDEFIKIISGV